MTKIQKEVLDMNVLIKRLAIGGVLYAVAETSFLMGKGLCLEY